MHKQQKKVRALLTMVTIFAVVFGVVGKVPFVQTNVAHAAITSLVGVDTDTTGSGADGRDISLSWTPGSAPTGFTGLLLYLFPKAYYDGQTLTAGNIKSTGCGGSACSALFPQPMMDYNMSAMALPMFVKTDSQPTPQTLATGAHRVCIFVDATTDELACSSEFTITSDTVADANAPFVDFMPVNAATAGADAYFYAMVNDDQVTTANIVAASGAKIKYAPKNTVMTSGNQSNAAGTVLSGNLVQFVLSNATIGLTAGNTLQYYLIANDGTNTRYFCANPTASSEAACIAAPFTLTAVTAGAITAKGVISANANGAQTRYNGIKVIAGGYAKQAVTTATDGAYGGTQGAGDGVFSFSGLPASTPIEFMAYASGFCANKRLQQLGSGAVTNIDFNVNFGECSFGGGDMGGTGGKPRVIFSGPPDSAGNVALTEKIRVGINQPLTASTVNDSNAGDAGSAIYLTIDGSDKIAGAVLWCANQAATGCSGLASQDTNTILFSPTSNLTASKFYTLVITETVTSESGQSIEGNRSGGGHKISFSTSGGAYSAGTVSANFGQGGQYLPPYVKSTVPAPGMSVKQKATTPFYNFIIEFNETMNSSTISTSSIKLKKISDGTFVSGLTVGLDTNEYRFVTVTPGSALAVGEYEIQILGSVANNKGMSMRAPTEGNSIAFSNRFTVSSENDSTAPTVYPMLANNATGVAVNIGCFQFGFNEQIQPSLITNSNFQVWRGATAISSTVTYDPGENNVYICPTSALMPNTVHSITIATNVKDLAGNALASQASYTYTTGSADTTAPKLKEARCDDYKCFLSFTEPMNIGTPADSDFGVASVLNYSNWTLTAGTCATPGASISLTGKTITYNAKNYSATLTGISGLANGDNFCITAGSAFTDLSGNALYTTGSANKISSKTESSKLTFGSFDGGGMFGPPISGTGSMGGGMDGSTVNVTMGGEFKPQGFGSFTADQFAMGQADMAFPFNPMASQNSNVFQTRFSPGSALLDDDLIVLTFPSGTDLTNAVPDDFSPFKADFNESRGAGTVTFDSVYGEGTGMVSDSTARTVTVKLAVSGGSPGANDQYTIDLKGITNPAIPKGPETGGYTVGIKVVRAGATIASKTSMPYFIMAGGTNTITIKVYAGSTSGVVNADGVVFLHGGGPGGSMDKALTIDEGKTIAADGASLTDSSDADTDVDLVYSNLPNGCYFFGTDPFVALGGVDYYGQMMPEPVCVNSGQSVAKNIILTSSAGGASVRVTVKLPAVNFGGVDLDIFAGGPGKFVVKTISAVGTPNSDGYDIRLNANGPWNIGFGPAMSKSTSKSMPKSLVIIPPPPVEIVVADLGGTPTIAQGMRTPAGVTVNTTDKVVTFGGTSLADKTVTGTVKDGSGSGLANVNVFMHALGFGQPAFALTKSDGTFSISVADYGTYELGAGKDGLPPVMNNIEIRPDGSDVGSDPDIFYKGKQITGGNPLVISLKKGAYTISGKVLDASNNGINNAPVFATDTTGNFVPSMTSNDGTGSYSVFVDAGTWTVKSELPPDKSDTCGALSATVTVSTESKSGQNLTPSTTTCYTVSGLVTIGGSAQANVPIFVNEWDVDNSRPVAGGIFRPSSTNSSGVYSVKVVGSKTYRIGTFSPTTGEISKNVAVTTSDIDTSGDANGSASINSGTTGTVTVAFTGGASSHEAYIELKKSDDKFTRVSKTQKDLSSSKTFTVKAGTYDYFVDVFGVGKYSGTVATGATATIDLSSSSLVTLSGNVKDNSSTVVSGAVVTVKDSTGMTKSTTTDSSGNYSVAVKAGTYTVSTGKSEFIPGQIPASVTLTTNTANYDFGGTSPDQVALKKSDQVISGTVYKSDGVTKASEGFVSASDASGTTVTAPVNSDGTYSLPVDDGTWTIKGAAPLHAKTTLASTVTTTGTTDQTSKNITLTADATKTSATNSTSLSATSGGSLNDSNNTGIKLTAGQGVLETSGDVTLNVEKSFTAPDTGSFKPLADATFAITAKQGNTNITDLKGNAEIQLDYTSIVSSLPSGVSEANLKLMYLKNGEYVPVEGGFTVDAANNTITGQTPHFTDFVIAYVPVTGSGSGTPDLTPPAAPINVKLTTDGSKVTIAWTDPGDSDLRKVEILRNAGGTTQVNGVAIGDANKGVQTYTDTTVTAGVTYKYQLQSVDTSRNMKLTDEFSITVAATATQTPSGGGGGGSTTSTTTTTTTTSTTTTPTTTTTTPSTTTVSTPATTSAPVAQLIHDPSKLDALIAGLGATRDEKSEAKYMSLIKSDAIAMKVGLTAEQRTAITNFVTYGVSEKTKALGAGERRALMRDYFETTGKAEPVWNDLDRMARGEKPEARNLTKERAQVKTALKLWITIAGTKAPDFKNSADDLAWNTLLYRIRFDRDLIKEKAGIVEFKAKVKRSPVTPMDWAAVRAMGYVLP